MSSFSIFIASTTTTVCPAVTASPARTSVRTTLPGMGLFTSAGPDAAAFAPSAEERARAERLVAAATGGAERFEGSMIERMHVEAARRLLERR